MFLLVVVDVDDVGDDELALVCLKIPLNEGKMMKSAAVVVVVVVGVV